MGFYKDHRKVRIDEETDCTKCAHIKVCDRDMSKRCKNYVFGTSEFPLDLCLSCLNKFTRFDKNQKDKLPCFLCKDFLSIGDKNEI